MLGCPSIPLLTFFFGISPNPREDWPLKYHDIMTYQEILDVRPSVMAGLAGPRSFINFLSHSHVYPPEFWELTAFLFFLVFSDPLTVGVDFQTQKDPKLARSFPNPILTVWGTTLAFDAIRVMASAGMSGWRLKSAETNSDLVYIYIMYILYI